MSIVKSLVGSVIGAGVGTAIYYGIQQSTGESYVWFPLVTGALTGIVARMFGGASSNAASFVCGALAALVAGIATFGVDLGPKFMEMNAERGPVAQNELMPDADKYVKQPPPAPEGSEPGEGETDGDAADGDSDSENSNVPANQAEEIAERSKVPEGAQEAANAAGPGAAAGAIQRKEETWVDLYLPYIFNGIGMLFAYQLARGFGPGTPKEKEAQEA